MSIIVLCTKFAEISVQNYVFHITLFPKCLPFFKQFDMIFAISLDIFENLFGKTVT